MNDQPSTRHQGRPGRDALRLAIRAVIAIVIIAIALAIGFVLGTSGAQRAASSNDETRMTSEAKENSRGYWTCGMHHWVILPEPGLCPICHMDLTPLDPAKLQGEIVIDPVVVQNIGVRIAPVISGPLEKEIRTVGTITYDENSVRDINAKVGGWIETLHVKTEGQPVEAGQLLFEIYSPELYQAQQEYLLAWRAAQEHADQTRNEIDLLDSARTRLRYFDISDEEIAELERSGKPRKTLAITSPFSGIVIENRAAQGMRVEPGMTVYRTASLSTVWVQATVYEDQLPLIESGQAARMTVPFLPGRSFEGNVQYVYPYLNAQARQGKVRIQFDNSDGALKPGMFATVAIAAPVEANAVLAPREAIINTGERELAFVSLGSGRFESRNVKTGFSSEQYVQVLEGLQAGEQVVTSGQFLLDSESNTRAALAKMIAGTTAADQQVRPRSADGAAVTGIPQPSATAFASLLGAYLRIGDALAKDSTAGVASDAEIISKELAEMVKISPSDSPQFWEQRKKLIATMSKHAAELDHAGALRTARVAYGHLSDALEKITVSTGVPRQLGAELDRFVCGMAPDVPQKGVWLQPANLDVRNPYFGTKMISCNLPDERRRIPLMGDEGASKSDDAGSQHLNMGVPR